MHSRNTKKRQASTLDNSYHQFQDTELDLKNASKRLKDNNGKKVDKINQDKKAQFVRTQDEILSNQKAINNDFDIDCDGFLEIFSQDLDSKWQDALFTHQTIILREGAGPNGYNSNPSELFSFENAINNHGDTEIECRIQNPTIYDYNVYHPKNHQHVYRTTMREYGEYAHLLSQNNYEELKKKPYYTKYFSQVQGGVMFAVNVDMDDIHWKAENKVLRSQLPYFFLNKGRFDFLSYHRQSVMGCTQPQMYLKVAGVWTGGHQENISVRAVNINHGDGESDWYCVDYDQVEKYRNYIIKKYNVDIHKSEGMWFGKYNDPDVIKAGIKIKKVVQRKGDIVILGPGVLHWVRCRGQTVQTAWNFALRTKLDILAMNERFQYNLKINFQTILLNKSLFLDLLNFEYYSLNQEVTKLLAEIILSYLQEELKLQSTLFPPTSVIPSHKLAFYDQLPAQLRHFQIYYCSNLDCMKEIFCYFGVFKSEFTLPLQELKGSDKQAALILSYGHYYCPKCLVKMQSQRESDQIILFRKFDLNSLRFLLERVHVFINKNGQEQPLYPIHDLTNVSHFCGQIPNVNDFIFNKDVSKLEQIYIPDFFQQQGFEEMHKYQLSLQQEKIVSFENVPITKLINPLNHRLGQVERLDIFQPPLQEMQNLIQTQVYSQQFPPQLSLESVVSTDQNKVTENQEIAAISALKLSKQKESQGVDQRENKIENQSSLMKILSQNQFDSASSQEEAPYDTQQKVVTADNSQNDDNLLAERIKDKIAQEYSKEQTPVTNLLEKEEEQIEEEPNNAVSSILVEGEKIEEKEEEDEVEVADDDVQNEVNVIQQNQELIAKEASQKGRQKKKKSDEKSEPKKKKQQGKNVALNENKPQTHTSDSDFEVVPKKKGKGQIKEKIEVLPKEKKTTIPLANENAKKQKGDKKTTEQKEKPAAPKQNAKKLKEKSSDEAEYEQVSDKKNKKTAAQEKQKKAPANKIKTSYNEEFLQPENQLVNSLPVFQEAKAVAIESMQQKDVYQTQQDQKEQEEMKRRLNLSNEANLLFEAHEKQLEAGNSLAQVQLSPIAFADEQDDDNLQLILKKKTNELLPQ